MDQLQVFRGRDYVINDKIRIRQPTIGEVAEYGEQKYFSVIRSLTATPADHKVEIWDAMHLYWDAVDEFDLFVSMFKALMHEDLSIVLPDIDFSSFRTEINPSTCEPALINGGGVRIDRSVYTILTEELRRIHQLEKNRETGYDEITKDSMIEDDRYDREAAAKKPFQSVILPFASYLAVRHGFDAVWNVPVGAFFYELKSEQKVRNYENVMRGIYSGCIDPKKIDKEEMRWV